jgi:hypothetical protein
MLSADLFDVHAVRHELEHALHLEVVALQRAEEVVTALPHGRVDDRHEDVRIAAGVVRLIDREIQSLGRLQFEDDVRARIGLRERA